MSDAKSTYLENKILDHTLRNTAFTSPTTVYLALFTSNPGESGSGSEVTGGSYARQTITFGAASGGVSASSNSQTFTSLPTATITHLGIYDASSGGNLLYYGSFSTSITVSSGDNITIDSGDITVTEN